MSTERDEQLLAADWTTIVRSIERAQQAFAVRLDGAGMTLPYFSVLTLLFAADDQRLPMSRLARDLAMTSGGFTKLADRMARDGLIDRRGSSGDRRVVFAALTDEGRAQARRAQATFLEFLRDAVLSGLSRTDLTTMAGLAGRLDAVGADADPDSFELHSRDPADPDRRTGD